MIEQNELLTLLVAIGVLIFVASNRRGLETLPDAKICLLAFMILVIGLASTVLEGLFWPTTFNLLEHACYGLSSVFLAGWVWLVFMRADRWRKT